MNISIPIYATLIILMITAGMPVAGNYDVNNASHKGCVIWGVVMIVLLLSSLIIF